MSATETTTDSHEDGHAGHAGPTPREYVQIALVLAVLTAAEISTYVVDFGPLGIPLLIALMIIKFVMVANLFMHLKFDDKMYTRMMYGGLILAAILYSLTLLIMLVASAPEAV